MIRLLLIVIQLQLSYYNTPTKSEVYDYMLSKDLIMCDLWMRVCITETNCGKTGVGKSHNNLFGFRYTKSYHYFSTWQASVDSLKSMVDRKYPKHLEKAHKTSICDGYHFIESIGYKTGIPYSAGEKSYTKYLRRIIINF